MKRLTSIDEVPKYLRGSPHCRSVVEQGEGATFIVPDDCLSEDAAINRPEELFEFLKTVQYWQVPEFILESVHVLKFVLDPNNREAVLETFADFEDDIPQLKTMKLIVECAVVDKMKQAAGLGVVGAVITLYEEYKAPIRLEEVVAASAGGHIDCLCFLLSKADAFRWRAAVCQAAAEAGHIECLQFCLDADCFIDCSVQAAAAKEGHLDIMILLHSHNCEWDARTVRNAAYYGHLDCLRFACEQGAPWNLPSDLYLDFNEVAVCEGQVVCLQYLRSLGYNPSDATMAFYATAGHARTLNFLLNNSSSLTKKTVAAMQAAIRCNDVDCLTVLVDHVPPLERAQSDLCDFAVAVLFDDKIEVLICLMTSGFPWGLSTMNAAVAAGNVEIVSFLFDNGCHWDVTTTAEAARYNRLACLTFLQANGCPWDSSTTEAALEDDFHECFAFALENGCPHAPDMDIRAVQHSQVQCLRHLIDTQMCVLNAELAVLAAQLDTAEVLQLLHEKGCPWDENTCITAVELHRPHCFAYAYEHGCPCRVTNSVKNMMYLLMKINFPVGGATVDTVPVKDLILTACKHHSRLFLRFIRDLGYPWNEEVTTTIVAAGSAVCLRHALTHRCPAPADLATIAALHDQLPCLQVALEFGYQLLPVTCRQLVEHGKAECLARAVEEGCALDASLCETAVALGHKYVLTVLHSLQCPWDERATAQAARMGDLGMLSYLHQQGCPWDMDTFRNAIVGGQVPCVEYMFDHNCPLDFMHSVTLAAEHGHIAVIEFLRERCLPWSPNTCAAAAANGQLECLQHLHEAGCAWDMNTCMMAGTQKCFDYAVANGCPGAHRNLLRFEFSG